MSSKKQSISDKLIFSASEYNNTATLTTHQCYLELFVRGYVYTTNYLTYPTLTLSQSLSTSGSQERRLKKEHPPINSDNQLEQNLSTDSSGVEVNSNEKAETIEQTLTAKQRKANPFLFSVENEQFDIPLQLVDRTFYALLQKLLLEKPNLLDDVTRSINGCPCFIRPITGSKLYDEIQKLPYERMQPMLVHGPDGSRTLGNGSVVYSDMKPNGSTLNIQIDWRADAKELQMQFDKVLGKIQSLRRDADLMLEEPIKLAGSLSTEMLQILKLKHQIINQPLSSRTAQENTNSNETTAKSNEILVQPTPSQLHNWMLLPYLDINQQHLMHTKNRDQRIGNGTAANALEVKTGGDPINAAENARSKVRQTIRHNADKTRRYLYLLRCNMDIE